MTTLLLDTIARRLDAFPHMTQADRADVYRAWDSAGDQDLDFTDEGSFDDYCESPAGRAWRRVRDVKLQSLIEGTYRVVTLEEAAYFGPAPTKTEILHALARAEQLLAV